MGQIRTKKRAKDDKLSLTNRLQVERCPLNWAQWVAREFHYLRREVHPRAHPFAYRVTFDGQAVQPDGKPSGMVMFATVHYTKQKELFGYGHIELKNCTRQLLGSCNPDEKDDILAQLSLWVDDQKNWRLKYDFIDKWQVLVLSRMWLHDNLPRNSETVAMAKIWQRIHLDWLEHHPPVDNLKPYHIRLIVSWSDLGAGHDGTVYKAANLKEIKRTTSQERHGKSNTRGSGGFENLIQYAYWLKEPRWKFEQAKLFEAT